MQNVPRKRRLLNKQIILTENSCLHVCVGFILINSHVGLLDTELV